MENNTKIYVMPHTHWDREWYFDSSKSTIFLIHTVKELIKHLNNDENYKYFLLDAQVSLIDDYLKYCPEDEEIIKNFIAAGRILIGPWYTQTDLLVISGESVVRNLYYGTKRAKELGGGMPVAYAPDCFGQSAQMPQIYNGFNIDKCVFRRGKSSSKPEKAEFYWQTTEGSKVFTHNVVDYGNMINPPINTSDINVYLNEKIKELQPLTNTNSILLMNGQDQRPVRKDLTKIIEKAKENGFNIEIENLENALNEMEKTADFESYVGEFTFGEKSRVHKSIFSTRADLKILNNKLENKIVNVLEPMCAIAYSLGIPYQHKIIEEIWKLMFDNSAHDSIGMCNSDSVNEDIYTRFKKANSLCDNMCEMLGRLIGDKIETKDAFQFQVYNFLPYKRSNVIKTNIYSCGEEFEISDSDGNIVEFEILSTENVTDKIYYNSAKEIGVNGEYSPKWFEDKTDIYACEILLSGKDIPAMGYKSFYISKAEKVSLTESGDSFIENEKLVLQLDKGIKLVYKDKNITINDFFQIEDSGDEGDTYDYSLPRHDRKYEIDYSKVRDVKVEKNSLSQTLSFTVAINLPENLVKREKDTRDKTVWLDISFILYKDSDFLKVNIKLENTAFEHRMRAVFKSGFSSEYSTADQQFGSIKRVNVLKEADIWEKENWVEKPRTIEPMQSYASLKSLDYTLAVFTDCVREYQIIGDDFDKIALTLFRSVPFMGKSNLLDRPGRASGMEWETPDAKLIKNMEFNYWIMLCDSKDENYLALKSKEIFTPLSVFANYSFLNNYEYFILNSSSEKNLPNSYSLMEFEKATAVLSAFKKSEEGDGFIVRLFCGNLENSISDKISLNENLKASLVKLDETTKVDDFTGDISLKASQFKTIKFSK